nr:hypothetical protein FBMMDGCC_00102 [Klebsiella pneumoniae subsp. pneumoniae]
MADSPVNRMSFSWHDIFTLMKQTRNLSEKAEVITTVWALPCKLDVSVFCGTFLTDMNHT